MTKLDDIIRGEDAVARNTMMVLDAFYSWMDTPPKRETTMPTTRSYATTNERIDEALAVVDELIEWADADAQHASENDASDTARDDMRRGTQLRTARKLIEDSRR